MDTIKDDASRGTEIISFELRRPEDSIATLILAMEGVGAEAGARSLA